MANAIRTLAMDAVELAKSGHPGLPMGAADIATVLFTKFLKFDPTDPHWPDRDRFILSNGHGSMLLYSLLYLTGYPAPTLDDIKRFRQWGSPCAGHPEYGHLPGVETTTGPLGQGIATAVGMALAERILNARFGDGLVNHKTYVIASDGDPEFPESALERFRTKAPDIPVRLAHKPHSGHRFRSGRSHLV